MACKRAKIHFDADRKECDVCVDHLYPWTLREVEVWVLRVAPTSTGGEKETSWHLKRHDSSIITCAFFITKGRYSVGI